MKRSFFISLILMCLVGVIKAETVSHTFNFSESDFAITATETDSLAITSIKGAAAYPDPTEPWIPIIGKNIALSADQTVKNINYTISKRLIRSGVDLKNAPMAIPTSMSIDDVVTPPGGYAANVYPSTNCTLSKCYRIGGVNVASLLVTPFVFDAQNRNLYFVDSLQVELETEASMARNIIPGTTASQMELLEATIENNEILDYITETISDNSDYFDDYIEYLIITCDSLKESFRPLAEWKRKKGVPSKIITTEEIDQQYEGSNKKAKIKSCINDIHLNNGIQFVLLGGDVNIIPTQRCYVSVSSDEEQIPADIYYACADDLNWDTDGNGKAGEISDSVNIVPNLFVTRLPVRNSKETDTIINRIIEYEKSPNFLAGILQVGYTLSNRLNGINLADKLFDEVINGKIRMEVTRCYDSYTVPVKENMIEGLSDELVRGHQFIEIFSHGSANGFGYNGDYFFNREMANTLDNIGHTFLTTMACNTNEFDHLSVDSCMSEALIRNPNSGIVGYLGSSREGWFINSQIPQLSYSLSYEKDFYDRLLNTETQFPRVKHFGALVNYIKHTHLLYVDSKPIYRWLHFSLNALGDPETPIFNTYPEINYSATVEIDGNGCLIVDAGIDGAKVCISSVNNDSFYQITHDRVSTTQTGEGIFDIWITKQNYIPKHFRIRNIALLPPPEDNDEQLRTNIISISPNPANSYVAIRFERHFDNSDLKVSFTNFSGGAQYLFNISDALQYATIDISSLPSGVYIVNLIENGILSSDAEQLIKN